MDQENPRIFKFTSFDSEFEVNIDKNNEESTQCVKEDLDNCCSISDRIKFVDQM